MRYNEGKRTRSMIKRTAVMEQEEKENPNTTVMDQVALVEKSITWSR
jgi:hypothetical protein